MKNYLVDEGGNGQRIDLWLAQKLGQARNQVQRLLSQSEVMVNNKKVSTHYLVHMGDEVSLRPRPIVEEAKQATVAEEKRLWKVIKIIDETVDYIVINKPAGLIMHQAVGVTGLSVVDWLLERYPEVRSVGEDPERPGIVHRLDKEVSGLVVMAKTQAMFDHLKEQFQKRIIQKHYIALVHGSGLPLEGTINFRLERSSTGHKMAAKPLNQTGKTALTLFRVEQTFHNYTLVRIEIKTGRTHQIRAHFAAYGHPVVGDDIYAGLKLRELNKKLNLGRIFLVATDLSFFDLAGEKKQYQVNLPLALHQVLQTLP